MMVAAVWMLQKLHFIRTWQYFLIYRKAKNNMKGLTRLPTGWEDFFFFFFASSQAPPTEVTFTPAFSPVEPNPRAFNCWCASLELVWTLHLNPELVRIKQLDSGPLERGGHLQVREQYVTSVNASCTNHSELCLYVSFLVVTGGDVSKLWITKCGEWRKCGQCGKCGQI